MPGFDTLGARLARSRRKLERERAAVNVERLAQNGLDIAIRSDGAAAAIAASAPKSASAQVIRFPSLNGRIRD
jgi:hypothetical protein